MNCTQARFLIYAYLDRDISTSEAELLARHLAACDSCELRARSARGLARVLHSRVDRATAPPGLRHRLRNGSQIVIRHRSPAFAAAAAVLLLILPVVADGPSREPDAAPALTLANAGFLPAAAESRRVTLTGTLVCLQCDTRHEAGLCPLPETDHEPGFCADDGQVWRLMARDPSFTQATLGQTVTVEGIEFPRSGFLRASRVGY